MGNSDLKNVKGKYKFLLWKTSFFCDCGPLSCLCCCFSAQCLLLIELFVLHITFSLDVPAVASPIVALLYS